MTDIEIIRELHCYKKMYNVLQATITECIKSCRDLTVRERLMAVQQEAEDIYTGEIFVYKSLNADERVIVALLKFIMNREVDSVDWDENIFDDSLAWVSDILNIKCNLTEEEIEEQVKRIFHPDNEEESSEQ